MAGTYNTTQMVYSFTFSANSAGGLSFSNASGEGFQSLQAYVSKVASSVLGDSIIQGLIGNDWASVWGPVVYSNNTTGASVIADNTLGCYYSPSNNLFVIPVAGTNPGSMFDWLSEDLDVSSVVSWSTIAGAGSGNISTGTNTGLQILLSMKDSGGSTMLQALAAFISKNSIKKATVAVGGHSLGGALSPVLALFMLNQQSTWDPGKTQSISVFPTAGPTPGDGDFAAYYNGVITDKQLTYSSIYNTLDVVPLAWAASDIATIPSIYDAQITPVKGAVPTDLLTGTIASGLQINASVSQSYASNPFTQVSNGRSSVAGSFSWVADIGASYEMNKVTAALTGSLATYSPYLVNLGRFVVQAIWQHTQVYQGLLNITDFNNEYQIVLTKNKPTSAASTGDLRAAVTKVTGLPVGDVDGAVAAEVTKAAKAV